MGVNHPSIEPSDLTTTRKIVPHATSLKEKEAGGVCDGGRREGKRKSE
jgi:hypothetical protein